MDWRAALKSLIEDTEAHVKALEELQPARLKPVVETAPFTTVKEPVVPPAHASLSELKEPAAIPAPAHPTPVDNTVSAILAATPQSEPPISDSERADIVQRVAEFKALQARMQQEREDYYFETLARARKLP